MFEMPPTEERDGVYGIVGVDPTTLKNLFCCFGQIVVLIESKINATSTCSRLSMFDDSS